MKTSETIGNLAKALAAAQGKMSTAVRDKDGQVLGARYKYASLEAVREIAREPLAENGLAVVQSPLVEFGEGKVSIAVTTRIIHASGEWIETDPFTLHVVRPQRGGEWHIATDPQAIGSATTYALRYSFKAALGITDGDDDDGARASSRQPQTQSNSITPAQWQTIQTTAAKHNVKAKDVLAALGVTQPREIRADQFDQAMKLILPTQKLSDLSEIDDLILEMTKEDQAALLQKFGMKEWNKKDWNEVNLEIAEKLFAHLKEAKDGSPRKP